MDALQIVFKAVDKTVRDGYLIDDVPPWEEPVKVVVNSPQPLTPPQNSNLSDAEGLRRAYDSLDNIFIDGKESHVCGRDDTLSSGL